MKSHFFFFALIVALSGPAHAKSWWLESCERLLGRQPEAAKRLSEIAAQFESHIRHNNQHSKYPLIPHVEGLSFLKGRPFGLVIRPQQSSVNLVAFANPKKLDLDWNDRGSALGQTPAFFLLVEDVPTRMKTGERCQLSDVIREEVSFIHERNPELRFELHSTPAAQFPEMEFNSDVGDHVVFWVTGDIPNSKVKRILLLALEEAIETLRANP